MVAPHAVVSHDVERIKQIARDFKATQVVETTNKRTVMWCPDRVCASNLAVRINQEGFSHVAHQGLRSTNWYVQVFY